MKFSEKSHQSGEMDYLGFYINLDRSSQRRYEICEQLKQLQMLSQYSRFPAADGNVLNVERFSISLGEIGCFTSHYLLLEKNLNQTHHIHVMEDDVILSRATKEQLQILLNSNLLDNFDLIFTDTCLPLDLFMIRQYKTLFDKNVEKDNSGRVISVKQYQVVDLKGRYIACTSSFLIHKNAIAKVHKILQQEMKIGLYKPIDLVIRDKINSGLIRAACIFPFITSVRLDYCFNATIQDRYKSNLPILAMLLLRHSFFVECDWAKCQQLIADHLVTKKQDIHQALLSDILNFVISDQYPDSWLS